MNAASVTTYEKADLERYELLPEVKELKEKGYKILVINLPMTGEWVYRRFMESLFGLCAGDAYMYFLSDKIKILLNICTDFPIDHNRNKSVRKAIEELGADYILQLDTDQTFPRGTIMHLMESLNTPDVDGSEREAVAGMYFMKSGTFRPVLGPYTKWESGMDSQYLDKLGFICRGECGEKKHEGGGHQLVRWSAPHFWPEDRMFRVDVIGVGCVLTRASMWKRLQYPFFQYRPDPMKGMRKGDAMEISEDMFWCANMHRAGVKVWIDPRVKCGHLGILEADQGIYQGGFRATLQAMEARPDDDPAKKQFNEALVDLR